VPAAGGLLRTECPGERPEDPGFSECLLLALFYFQYMIYCNKLEVDKVFLWRIGFLDKLQQDTQGSVRSLKETLGGSKLSINTSRTGKLYRSEVSGLR
jgi:hypothetical protein